MNVYLIQLIGKIFSLLIVALTSLFNTSVFQTESVHIINTDQNRIVNVVNTVVPYEIVTKYNSKLPSTTTNVLQQGMSGISYVDETGTTTVLQEMVPQVVEVGTGAKGTYVGRVTGYGPDCLGCSKAGNVSCRTREGKKHSLYNGAIYHDVTYGDVRILAGARSLFPCGTIIDISNGKTAFTGIILDSGGSMEKAWQSKGSVWIDIAYTSQAEARTQGIMSGNNIHMQVKRWGW